eukprot:1487620-Prymnesium_polylepis.1
MRQAKGGCSPISISSTASSATRLRRGELSATDSDMSKVSSTAITPKESSRKIQFKHQGNTPPGHYCLLRRFLRSLWP